VISEIEAMIGGMAQHMAAAAKKNR
jgi:hypothetical protein